MINKFNKNNNIKKYDVTIYYNICVTFSKNNYLFKRNQNLNN